jgi:hypothetical protein
MSESEFVRELVQEGIRQATQLEASNPASCQPWSASADSARRAPRHPRTHRSTTATAMPALPKMDWQRAVACRLERAGVPAEYRAARTKPEMALAEIDRVIAAGVRFGCVLADAGMG